MRFARAARARRPSRLSGATAGASGGSSGGGSILDAIMALGPAQYLPLAGTDPTAYADVSGNARHATAVGAPTLNNVAGPDGLMYPTLGASIAINCGLNAAWAGETVRTHIVAFRPTAWSNSSCLLSEYQGGTVCEFQVFGASPSLSGMTLDSNGNVHRRRDLTTAVQVNKWNFLTFAPKVPGDTVDPDIRLNGAVLGGTRGSVGGYMVNWSSPLRLGARQSGGASFFLAGAVAHAAVIPRLLTEGEFSTLFATAAAAGWIGL